MKILITILLTLNLSFLFGQVERKSDFQIEIIDSISTTYLNDSNNSNFNYQLCKNILNINISDSVQKNFLRLEFKLKTNKKIEFLKITLTEYNSKTTIVKYNLRKENIEFDYLDSLTNEIRNSFSFKLIDNSGLKIKTIKGFFNIKLSETPCEIVYNKLAIILPLFKEWKVSKFIDSAEHVLPEGENLVIKFNGNKVNGSIGCNLVEGDLWIKNDLIIEITNLWTTLLYCPEEDDRYGKKLFNAIKGKEVLYFINKNTLTLIYDKKGYKIILYPYKYCL